MRLDSELVKRGLFASRTRAARAIEAGCIKVNGSVIVKSSFDVKESDVIASSGDPLSYVGRGALKLKEALKIFSIDVNNKNAIDIGASTGGFTQVLLENGAKSVFAVDVGHGQLAEILKNDSRVVNAEGTDFRGLSSEYNNIFDFACSDVSFISVTLILPKMYDVLRDGADAVILVKPQFETEDGKVGKGGVVRDEKKRRMALDKAAAGARACGFNVLAAAESPIRGGDGNVEYLLHIKK